MDKKLQNFIERDDCFFIHYASDGFFNGSNPAPKISCIILYNLKTNKTYGFSIKDYKNNSLEQQEKSILEAFKSFIENYPNISFIHWAMTSSGFGFGAIQKRAKDFGIDLPLPDNEHLFDLSSYVAYIAEKRLSVKQILWFNSLLIDDDFLDGKTEAEYFCKKKFEEIYSSVSLKVHGFAEVVKLLQENKLKIEPPKQNNDGLANTERRKRQLEISKIREKMLKDITEHNKRVLKRKEYVLNEDFEMIEKEEEHTFLFFDFNHPIFSLFGNWFINRK